MDFLIFFSNVRKRHYSGKCFISYSKCKKEDAEALKKAVIAQFPNIKEIPAFDIGTIIATHCGPETAAVFFLGEEREA